MIKKKLKNTNIHIYKVKNTVYVAIKNVLQSTLD